MLAVDLHQHLWPTTLVELLRGRTRTPYLRGWTLVTDGEPPCELRPSDHEVGSRIAAGPPLGDRSRLPQPLRAARDRGAPARRGRWSHRGVATPASSTCPSTSPRGRRCTTVEPDLGELTRLLGGPLRRRPAAGDDLLGTPAGWEAAGEVLLHRRGERQAGVRAPRAERRRRGDLPAWWAPVVGYVAQLQAAWWAWHAFGGRALFPRLRLVFAAGAGLAPVHHERLSARGGRPGPVDPDVFVDTSSYGAQGPRRVGPRAGHRLARARQRPTVRRAGPGGPR